MRLCQVWAESIRLLWRSRRRIWRRKRPRCLATPLREIPLEPAPAITGYRATPPKTPAQLTLERQLSGAVFSQSSSPMAPAAGSLPPVAAPEPGELSTLLRPGVTTAVSAQLLPTQRLLLPKGAFLDCTLETAIDSTLARHDHVHHGNRHLRS